jgi:hypothetical protein
MGTPHIKLEVSRDPSLNMLILYGRLGSVGGEYI